MNGTEKQVKWAEQICQEAIAWGNANIEELKRVGLPEDFAKDLEQRFLSLVSSKQEAKWWVDRRKLQMGVPAEYQSEISDDLRCQIPPLRQAISAKYDIVWQIRGLRR